MSIGLHFYPTILLLHHSNNLQSNLITDPAQNTEVEIMRLIMHTTTKLIIISLVLFSTAAKVSSAFNNETDRLALLAFKNLITYDPKGSLSSWNSSLDVCEWQGITCSRKHQRRVVVLDLSFKSLSGSISPSIGNLSFLRSIFLQDNHFRGNLPPDLSRLHRLQHLNLTNNTLQGEIPANLSHCPELRVIALTFNDVVGKIPASFGSLSKLTFLSLFSNNLIGGIPPSLCNLTLLQKLSLGSNSLTGTIPRSIGRLRNLEYFGTGVNKLSGTVPPALYNITTLTDLVIPANQFRDSLPSNIGLTLPNLQKISVGGGGNQFRGPFPVSFRNASRMIILDLNNISLFGPVPYDLGRKMKDLWWLNLGDNNLGTGDTSDLSFIDSLTNCSNFQVLGFSRNSFGGVLPSSIANLSTQLNILQVGENQLVGTIPAGISNLVNLAQLYLELNRLSGSIPFEIGKLRNLQQLDFSRNKLSGPIPSSIGNLTRIFQLNLEENNLTGSIASSGIENIQGLQKLNLSYNLLVGPIPKTVGLLSALNSLGLAHNSFIGSLPLEIGSLNNLQELDVSSNQLSGPIPSTLGNCLRLEHLLLEGNMFQGSIPPSLSTLKGIETLDLSRNNLSGQIPIDIGTLMFLKNLNLSFNSLAGEVPSKGVFRNTSMISVVGNTELCGGIAELQLPACPPSQASMKKGISLGFKIIVPIACVVACLTLIPVLVAFLRKRKQRNQSPNQSSIGDDFLRVSYDQLIKATDGFSSSNLIGAGSFGTVYKGRILHQDEEKPIAVKVLNLDRAGASKSFISECDVLRKTRHRNLLKIITACSSVTHVGDGFKALVFEYMPNGSLEKWLHPGDQDAQFQTRNLDLGQRLNLAIDVVCALDYLHHRGETPIVHCDLKPSNVLVDENMNARVGDFGLARFLTTNSSNNIGGGQTNSIAIKGSIGYVAPEYGIGGQISTQGDVYSYGILLLEMLTGKRPTDEMFTDGLSLHKFSKLALPEQVMEIVDSRMLLEEPNESTDNALNEGVRRAKTRECLISLVRIGVACSAESPSKRMDINEVVIELTAIKEVFLGVGIHGRRQLRMQLAGEGTSQAGY